MDGDNKTSGISMDKSQMQLQSLTLMEPPPMMIPLDLIAEILVRLPVKSILRSKCVCKSWNALISHPRFVHKHLISSAADLNRHRLMVAYPHRSPSLPQFPSILLKNYFLPSLLHSSSSSTHLDLPPCHALNTHFFSIIGACHGMLCLSMDEVGLVLWNPSIRSFKMLPSITWPQFDFPSNLVGWGFGYDHSSRSYQAVSVYFYDALGGYETIVMLHTLGTDSWRSIQKFPTTVAKPAGLDGKFASGTFNWLCLYDRNNSSSSLGSAIVSLDPVTERYQQLLLPDGLFPVRFSRMEIGELKGCLSIVALRDIDNTTNRVTDVWAMKEYGNKESWTKLFSIPFIKQSYVDYFPAPVALWISDEDDEILLKEVLDLNFYNSKSGASIYHEILRSGSSISAAAYAESLVSPCF